MAPKRIQRRRTRGWRMPDNARYVGRPSRWGNPFRPGEPYRFATARGLVMGVAPDNPAGLVRLFHLYVMGQPVLHAFIRGDLAGWDLACWCPLGMPCHADVLLAIAVVPGVSVEDRAGIAEETHQERTADADTRYQEHPE